MVKEYKIVLIVILSYVLIVNIEPFAEDIFNNYTTYLLYNSLLSDILVNLLLLVLLSTAVHKLDLYQFIGFRKPQFVKDKGILVLLGIFILSGVWVNWEIYSSANARLLILFMLFVAIGGITEELCFRGIVLPLLLNRIKESRRGLYVAVSISAIIFGLLHFNNLLNEPNNITGILFQVLAATSVGVFFGALMLRTGNILVVSIFHGSLNFIFGPGLLKKEAHEPLFDKEFQSGFPDLIDLLGTLAIFGIIVWIGIVMIKKVDRTAIVNELEGLKV